MKITAYIFLIATLAYGCHAQNAISTNEIFPTKAHLFGLRSQSGELLIDSIYTNIRIIYDHQKLILPPREGREAGAKAAYYLVTHPDERKAIFDQDGEIRFDFIACTGIILDQASQTAVVSKEVQPHTRPRSFLYKLNGEQLLDAAYKNIGYISYSPLIALVAEDSPNEEYYLYHPAEEKMLGPYDHFNIYNQDFTTPKGLAEPNFATYKADLNLICIRKQTGDDYLWGMIDSHGKEILPMAYLNLNLFSESDQKHPAFKQAIKPEGVDFIFRGTHISDRSTTIFFDSQLNPYAFKIIPGEKNRIEKM